MRNTIILAAALTVLSACTAKNETTEPAQDEAPSAATTGDSIPPPTDDDLATHITAADKDRTVEVKVGTKIQVELSGVPTAGYMWAVAETPAFLAPDGDTSGPTTMAQNEPGFAGGNHWEVFFFNVTGEGSGILRLEQKRAWESDEPPADTFSVTINAVAAN